MSKQTRRPETKAPGPPVKSDIREFYNGITRRLGQSKVGDFSYFLNLGYLSLGEGDEARPDALRTRLDPAASRLVCELVGDTDLREKRVLDVGCGRGGGAALLASVFGARVVGVDLAPEAVSFCRRRHPGPNVRFEVGDAENLPVESTSIDVVTNIESSHVYPDLGAFFSEVRRVLKSHGMFLYTDVFPVRHWERIRGSLASLGFETVTDRDITRNVLASCDAVAASRAKAFGGKDASIDHLLAVPGSEVYEQMRAGEWEYRILRAKRLKDPESSVR